MLECKSEASQVDNDLPAELIDTCWNVNLFLFNMHKKAASELIDTCWNVNLKHVQTTAVMFDELIDTCWNVNVGVIQPDFF